MCIHYIHFLYFSYLFRFHIHHHQEELLRPLLKTSYCCEANNSGFYSSYAVIYGRYNCEYIGIMIYINIYTIYYIYTIVQITMWHHRAIVKT